MCCCVVNTADMNSAVASGTSPCRNFVDIDILLTVHTNGFDCSLLLHHGPLFGLRGCCNTHTSCWSWSKIHHTWQPLLSLLMGISTCFTIIDCYLQQFNTSFHRACSPKSTLQGFIAALSPRYVQPGSCCSQLEPRNLGLGPSRKPPRAINST